MKIRYMLWRTLYLGETMLAAKLDPRMGDGFLWKLSDWLCDRMLISHFGKHGPMCRHYYETCTCENDT